MQSWLANAPLLQAWWAFVESGPWPVTTFVLVPGACHGGWWYQPLVTELQRAEALIPDLDLGWARPRRFGRGWVLAEFGDDPHRYANAKARKNYASTAPITRASGKSRVVLARYARNRRLADALYLWSFSALNGSPGARALYDTQRGRGATHHAALRALANRVVGILHGCLRHGTHYAEEAAWPRRTVTADQEPQVAA